MKTLFRRVLFSLAVVGLPLSADAATFADLDGTYSTNFTSVISVSGFGKSKGPAFSAPCTISTTASTLECNLGSQTLAGAFTASSGNKVNWTLNEASLSGLQSQVASGVSTWLARVSKKFNTKVDPSTVSFTPRKVRFKPITLPKGRLKNTFKADVVITGTGSATVNGAPFKSSVDYTVTLKFTRS